MLKAGLAVVGFSIVALGCEPDLKPMIVAPDNAKSQGNAEVGPNQHGGTLKVAPISAEDFAKLEKAENQPLCSVAGGKAVPGAKLDDMNRLIASWMAARARPSPAPGEKGPTAPGGPLGPRAELMTAPAEGDPLNALTSLAIDCTGEKPVLMVNSKPSSVDAIYGDSQTTGVILNDNGAMAPHTLLLAAWNATTSELTVIRARTASAPPPVADAESYKHWNAVLYRNLQGYVPNNAMPITARSVTRGSNNVMEVVFPMTGMSIKADALIVRSPIDGTSPSETIELDAVVKKAK